MKLFLLVFILILGPLSFATNEIDRVIGEDDLVTVMQDASNIPLRFRSLVDAFGYMSMSCTATHIGNGYVLTAGHCFWAGESLDENTSCEGETIQWGFREGEKPYLVSNCETVIAKQHSDHADFAIVKVSPIPPVAIAPDLTRRAITGDTLTLFSHPSDMTLQWSHSCTVEWGTVEPPLFMPNIDPPFLKHKCDTNPGSSGATLINILSLKVVGIHDGGFVNDNGTGMNYGTYIMDSPLYDILKSLGFK